MKTTQFDKKNEYIFFADNLQNSHSIYKKTFLVNVQHDLFYILI